MCQQFILPFSFLHELFFPSYSLHFYFYFFFVFRCFFPLSFFHFCLVFFFYISLFILFIYLFRVLSFWFFFSSFFSTFFPMISTFFIFVGSFFGSDTTFLVFLVFLDVAAVFSFNNACLLRIARFRYESCNTRRLTRGATKSSRLIHVSPPLSSPETGFLKM